MLSSSVGVARKIMAENPSSGKEFSKKRRFFKKNRKKLQKVLEIKKNGVPLSLEMENHSRDVAQSG